MIQLFNDSEISATDAKSMAQYIAFAPYLFQAVAAMRDLKIFAAIDKSRRTGISLESICERTGVSEYGVAILLDFAETSGLIRREAEKYYLTKTAYFLLHDEMTDVNFNFSQHFSYQGLEQLTNSIKSGEPKGLKVFGDWPTVYPGLTKLPERAQKSWFEFDHFYSDAAFNEVLKYVFANNPKHILDIGGNTGKFALKCLAYNSDVHLTIMDLAPQLEKAKANIQTQGFSQRFTAYPCDMLDPKQTLAEGADVVWMSQFLDCFAPAEIETILGNVVKGLDQDQQVLILETLWDRQKFNAASFSLNATSLYFCCFANGNSRMYASDPFAELIHKSGLVIEEEIDDIGLGHTLIRCKKA